MSRWSTHYYKTILSLKLPPLQAMLSLLPTRKSLTSPWKPATAKALFFSPWQWRAWCPAPNCHRRGEKTGQCPGKTHFGGGGHHHSQALPEAVNLLDAGQLCTIKQQMPARAGSARDEVEWWRSYCICTWDTSTCNAIAIVLLLNGFRY